MYRVWKDGRIVESEEPGQFAGIVTVKIFGRLTCWSGEKLANPKNRVYFHSWEEAVAAGMRPCKLCRPTPGDHYHREQGRWVLDPGLEPSPPEIMRGTDGSTEIRWHERRYLMLPPGFDARDDSRRSDARPEYNRDLVNTWWRLAGRELVLGVAGIGV